MNNIEKNTIEYCWRCGGHQEIACFKTENNNGYEECPECKGSGYGESLQTMWRRNGINPEMIKISSRGPN